MTVDHHQHNGNVKSISLYTDANEKKAVVEKSINDDDNINVQADPKVGTMEITCQEDSLEVNQGNVEEGNKETVAEYEHSLWKWPSGRSKLTKVTFNTSIFSV